MQSSFSFTYVELQAGQQLGLQTTLDIWARVSLSLQPITTVPKKEVLLILPYLGLQSRILTKQVKACINKFYGCFDLRVVFQSTHRIKSLFPCKDKLTRAQMSRVVYKASYCMGLPIPLRVAIMITQLLLPTMSRQLSHNMKWDHFEILARGRSDTHCKIKETLLIRGL